MKKGIPEETKNIINHEKTTNNRARSVNYNFRPYKSFHLIYP